jgi:uridylate kinase
MGMLATTINSLALADTFEQKGISCCVLTAVEMQSFADPYSARRARAELENGKVVILGGGSGLPFFSTDTAGVLRAAEIGADMVLLAKNIDGIYTADPRLDPTATRYDEITYDEVLEKKLRALDMSATLFCMENDLRCYAFALQDPQNIYRVVMGERVGTEMHI